MIWKPGSFSTVAIGAALAVAAVMPALADTYPVSGRWGITDGSQKGRIDCAGKRVITFSGDQRFDTGGGVPGYHNESVQTEGTGRWRIVDLFTTGQIRAGRTTLMLTKIDDYRITLDLQGDSTLALQRCK